MSRQGLESVMSLPTILPSIDAPEVPEVPIWPYNDEEEDD